MSALREDMCAAKRGLQGTYLDLEAQALKRIQAIQGLRPAILRTCQAATPASPAGQFPMLRSFWKWRILTCDRMSHLVKSL